MEVTPLSPPSLSNPRPLVTFALFAYNQERFIREAIEGAFSQTYEPLEIILSDDRSSDSTFSIMKQMAAAYAGPHSVRVRRSDCNAGTLRHVVTTAREAGGELFVVAAGDDISQPERVSKIVKAFLASGAFAFASRFDRIDEDGSLIERGSESPGNALVNRWFSYQGSFRTIHGATAAYRRGFVAGCDIPDRPVYGEDSFLSFFLALNALPVHRLPDSLVKYRSHFGTWSHGGHPRTSSEITEFELKCAQMANSYLALADFAMKKIEGQSSAVELRSRIREDREFLEVRAKWIESSAWARVGWFLKSRRLDVSRFLGPRLMGLRLFSQMKAVFERSVRNEVETN